LLRFGIVFCKFAENNRYIRRKDISQTVTNYIYQYKDWTRFTWRETDIHELFGEVRNLQGKIIGQMSMLGFAAKEEAKLTTLTLDVVKSSEIEGEILNYDQVRSSIARRLGVQYSGTCICQSEMWKALLK
jgi:hypothetical protein